MLLHSAALQLGPACSHPCPARLSLPLASHPTLQVPQQRRVPAAALPPAFNALQHLEAIDLQMVDFGGTLPPALQALSSVTRLDIALTNLQDQQASWGRGLVGRLAGGCACGRQGWDNAATSHQRHSYSALMTAI